MNSRLENLVWERARSLCEYCRFPVDHAEADFQIDHIVAQKHLGTSSEDNLALACYHCNTYKGPNIAGIDPITGRIIRLFHPRRDRWQDHFRWEGPALIGQTAIGRATVQVLWINHPLRVETRRLLIQLGIFPPKVP